MRLAAVIPHFQTPRETEICLAALRASSRPPDQIIVVDNGSSQPFTNDATVIRSQRNLGFSGGCNLGIERALQDGADLLLLLNSDTEIDRSCVERMQTALVDPVGIVGPAVVDMSPAARVESLGVRFSRRSGRMRNLVADGPVDAVIGACMLVRRSVFEMVGLFDPRFFYGFEDVEFCLRARSRGISCAVAPDARVRHHLARTIGPRSADRLYYAARNHLLAANLCLPRSAARSGMIVGYNLLHALFRSQVPLAAGLRAVGDGVLDHLRGKYGPR